MSDTTKIQWTDASWSPWWGCTKGEPRVKTKDWKSPKKWRRQASEAGTRMRVFPSMMDWLDDEVPVEWLTDFLRLIHDTPMLDWQLLTKRPENFWSRSILVYKDATEDAFLDWLYKWMDGSAPNNVWVGTSTENQEQADIRIPQLLAIPAKLRFLSCEPLLGPVDLRLMYNCAGDRAFYSDTAASTLQVGKIAWVIVGGESGPRARPCDIAHVRELVQQCANARVPCFVKQLGEHWVAHWQTTDIDEIARLSVAMKDKKGGDPNEWPADLRVRRFPTA